MSGRSLSASNVAPRVWATCICLHLQQASRAVARVFDDALRPVGLTNGQFSLLMSMSRPEPPAIGSLAIELAMDRTTLTACLKPLERRKLVCVTPDAKDRRSRILTLTAAGRKILDRAYPLWEQAQKSTLLKAELASPDRLRAELRALKG